MARGAPDWTQKIEVTINPGQPQTEQAAGTTGRIGTLSTAYGTVCQWAVAADKVGELKQIGIDSSDHPTTLWQITIDAVVWVTDWQVQASRVLTFGDLKLAEGATVTVEAKTTGGGTSAEAFIVATEIG